MFEVQIAKGVLISEIQLRSIKNGVIMIAKVIFTDILILECNVQSNKIYLSIVELAFLLLSFFCHVLCTLYIVHIVIC